MVGVIGAPVIDWEVRGTSACDSEERAVLGEFPQYGDIETQPEGNAAQGSCAVYYETAASEERVIEYFASRLREDGWEVDTEPLPEGFAGGDIVVASRSGGYIYTVYYEKEAVDRPAPGGEARLEVHVAREADR